MRESVLTRNEWLQVFGVDAWRSFTAMVQLHDMTRWQRPVSLLVDNAMSLSVNPGSPGPTVTSFQIDSSCPDPTGRLEAAIAYRVAIMELSRVMADHPVLRLPAYIPVACVRPAGKRRALAASAFAEAGRVRHWVASLVEVAFMGRGASTPRPSFYLGGVS